MEKVLKSQAFVREANEQGIKYQVAVVGYLRYHFIAITTTSKNTPSHF
ncbi:hypothetical protein [Bacteroides ovatus]|nr:hypothetical protein [Bacteroides ovatus]MBT9933449.1 hypothetical protein [Bacteroides ovatus]